MATFDSFRRLHGLAGATLAACSLLALLAAGPAAAGERRLTVPDQSWSGPFYARLEGNLVYETNGWVIIAFYRDPSCVPDDFNLLGFFDFVPGIHGYPRAFDCQLMVHGFEVYSRALPPPEGPPIHSKTFGNGEVQVLFVASDEFWELAGDGNVTLLDLYDLPDEALRYGTATFFEETLHPFQAAKQTMTDTVAAGTLEDGGTFKYHVTETKGTIRSINLEFR